MIVRLNNRLEFEIKTDWTGGAVLQPESILSFYIAKHSILERMCSQLAPLVCVILFLHYNF